MTKPSTTPRVDAFRAALFDAIKNAPACTTVEIVNSYTFRADATIGGYTVIVIVEPVRKKLGFCDYRYEDKVTVSYDHTNKLRETKARGPLDPAKVAAEIVTYAKRMVESEANAKALKAMQAVRAEFAASLVDGITGATCTPSARVGRFTITLSGLDESEAHAVADLIRLRRAAAPR